MARKHSPQHVAALNDLLKHLRVGADVALARPRYSTIPRATWYRLLAKAKEQFVAEGGTPPSVSASPYPFSPMVGTIRSRGRPRKQPKDGLNSQPAATHSDQAAFNASTPQAPSESDSKDSATATLQALFGPKEHRILDRWTDPPEKNPMGLDVPDQLMELYFDAQALAESCIKRIGTGHIILDQSAFAKSIELKRTVLTDYLKSLERYSNIEGIQKMVRAIADCLEQMPGDAALPLIKVIREAMRPFSNKLALSPLNKS